LVISLPDVTPFYRMDIRLPKLRYQWVGSRRKRPSPEQMRGTLEANGHYWEIGHPQTPLVKVLDAFEKLTSSCETWRVPEKPYHRFFRAEKEHAGG